MALAAPLYLCLFSPFIPARTLTLPCGELDRGTEEKPDLILTWIDSMIWFTGGEEKRKEGVEKVGLVCVFFFLNWQDLVIAAKTACGAAV